MAGLGEGVGKVMDGAAERGSVGAKAPGGEGPRERLMRLGAGALTDPELLAVLLGTGIRGNPVRRLAEELLAAGGGLKALAQCEAHELCARQGLGPARAAQVLAALELGRRVQRSTESRPRLATPEAIYRYLAPQFVGRRREEFHVLCLSSRNVLLADVRVAEGARDFCMVDAREVFRAALTTSASAVVLAHNHPSGDPEPSSHDLQMTRELLRGAAVVGLRILDHLVVGDGTYSSFLEQGRMEGLARSAGGSR